MLFLQQAVLDLGRVEFCDDNCIIQSPIMNDQHLLHDISLYRIDIEFEHKIDYENLLNPTSNNIENRYWIQISPKITVIFQIRIAFYWNTWKTCSFSKYGGVFGELFGMLALKQLYRIWIRIWKGRYRIELKKLRSCRTSSALRLKFF